MGEGSTGAAEGEDERCMSFGEGKVKNINRGMEGLEQEDVREINGGMERLR